MSFLLIIVFKKFGRSEYDDYRGGKRVRITAMCRISSIVRNSYIRWTYLMISYDVELRAVISEIEN